VVDPHPQLPGHAPTANVSFPVAPVDGIVERMWIEGLRDEAPAMGRHRCEPFQEPASARARPKNAEALAEQHDRVEDPERSVELLDTDEPGVPDAAPAAALDGAARSRCRPPPAQAHAASAATDVEYAPPDETHRAPLVRVVPAREGRDEVPRVEGHEEPVVALDDLVRASPRESVLVSVP
jgi:hypothetical protein